jgi:hypothetical protein
LAQVSKTHDPDTFPKASGHPDLDIEMNEEYRSLMENDTWDDVPLPKGRKLFKCKCKCKFKLPMYDGEVNAERLDNWVR